VVACTTNLWRDIDEAALRRFALKIEFRFLRPEQSMTLFRAIFGEALAAPMAYEEEAAVAAALSRLGSLAPGDFAAVARRVGWLGRPASAAELVAELEAEVRLKRAAPRAVGF
jgi:hypothetical protein